MKKFEMDKWKKYDRFLITGSSCGQYQARKRGFDRPYGTLEKCLTDDSGRFVSRAVEISQQGRALKNSYAIFALAYALAQGDVETRQSVGGFPDGRKGAALSVCRTASHLFELMMYLEDLGKGKGSVVHRMLQDWYQNKSPRDLGYQMMKYRSRHGLDHQTMLRWGRPKPTSEEVNKLYRWGVYGWDEELDWKDIEDSDALRRIEAFETLKSMNESMASDAAKLILKYRLPHECVPTWFSGHPLVQRALLDDMPYHALVWELGAMSASGMFDKYKESLALVCEKLERPDLIKRARVHPMNLLMKMRAYRQGRSKNLQWVPRSEILCSMERAFYEAFKYVEPTNKRFCLALDVSGSMDWTKVPGLEMSCREAASALSLVTHFVEPKTQIIGFTAGGENSCNFQFKGSRNLKSISELDFGPYPRLDDVISYVSGLGFGATDCSLPMVWAQAQKREFDVFVIYTDSETNTGGSPTQALKNYRKAMGVDAKLVVMGLGGRGFSIADPDDAGMLDLVGCDSAAPTLIEYFARGMI